MATLLFAPNRLLTRAAPYGADSEPRTSESGCAITYDVLFSSIPNPRYAESVFRLPRHLGLNREEPAGEPVSWRRAERCARCVECPVVCAAERATGDVGRRHLDHAVDGAIRRDPDDTRAPVPAVPQIAFAIHRGTVRQPARKTGEEGTLAADRSREPVEIVNANLILKRVGEVEPRLVGTPGERVGDADPALPFAHRAIRIHPKKDAVGASAFARRSVCSHVVAHRSDPERAAGIGPSVVQANGGPTVQAKPMVAALVRTRLPQQHAGAQRNRQRILTAGKRQRGHRLRQKTRTRKHR